MSKNTPGPWISEVGEVCCVRAQQDGGRIALMANLKGQFGLSGRRNASEVVANARLIAAAPDLLGAAEEAERVIDILWASHHANRADAALDALRSAIAKATGGEP